MHLTPEPSTPWTWAVHDGVFHFSKGPTGSTESFTIVSVTKSKFVLKDQPSLKPKSSKMSLPFLQMGVDQECND